MAYSLLHRGREDLNMPEAITPYTSVEEVQAIIAAYNGDMEAIAKDIAEGDESKANVEDLLVTLITETGSLDLLPFMLLEDPEAFPEAWKGEGLIVPTLEHLGDLEQYKDQPLAKQINAFLAIFQGTAEDGDEGGILKEIEDFLAEEGGVEGDDPEQLAQDTLNLYDEFDLKEAMFMFMKMGSPGFALLLLAAYSLGPWSAEAYENLTDLYEEGVFNLEDLQDETEGIDMEDPQAQVELQLVTTQLGNQTTKLQIITEITKQIQEMLSTIVEESSMLSQAENKTNELIIQNTG